MPTPTLVSPVLNILLEPFKVHKLLPPTAELGSHCEVPAFHTKACPAVGAVAEIALV